MIVISRWKWFIPVAVLALALCWPGLAPAATINYFGGGFYSQSQAYVSNGSEVDQTPLNENWSSTDAYTSPWTNVDGVSSSSTNEGALYSAAPNHQNVYVYSSVNGYSDYDNGAIYTYGNANTGFPTVTDGIFFIINSSAGEQVGDPVMLSWEWSAEANALSGGTASLTGGSYADMGIFLEDAPIWTKTGEVLGPGEDFSDDTSGEYLAHIGDIIGVHLGAYAAIELWGMGDNIEASSSQKLDLYVDTLPVPIPGAVWLLGSGLVGLAGLRRKLQR